MCRSVPQIAVFSILISTSFGPTCGSGTSSIQMPCSGLRLTRAFIVCDMGNPSVGPRSGRGNGNYRTRSLAAALTPTSCPGRLGKLWSQVYAIAHEGRCDAIEETVVEIGRASGRESVCQYV